MTDPEARAAKKAQGHVSFEDGQGGYRHEPLSDAAVEVIGAEVLAIAGRSALERALEHLETVREALEAKSAEGRYRAALTEAVKALDDCVGVMFGIHDGLSTRDFPQTKKHLIMSATEARAISTKLRGMLGEEV